MPQYPKIEYQQHAIIKKKKKATQMYLNIRKGIKPQINRKWGIQAKNGFLFLI